MAKASVFLIFKLLACIAASIVPTRAIASDQVSAACLPRTCNLRCWQAATSVEQREGDKKATHGSNCGAFGRLTLLAVDSGTSAQLTALLRRSQLAANQHSLSYAPPPVATGLPDAPDDTMTRNNVRNRVSPHGGANCACGSRPTDDARDLPIRGQGTGWNREEGAPHLDLKIGALDRKRESPLAAWSSAIELE